MDFKPVFRFLSSLKKNNNKEWFDAHRKEWDEIRKAFGVFTEALILDISEFDSGISGLQSKDCTFRINRDVRFSKDKSPYKSNMGAWMAPGGKKSDKAGYYLHIEPGHCFIAGGIYMPAPEILRAVRQEIDYNAERFLTLIRDKKYKAAFGDITGEALTRVPQGFSPAPEVEKYIKLKSLVSTRSFSDAEVTNAAFPKEISKLYKLVKPLNDFINEAIGDPEHE